DALVKATENVENFFCIDPRLKLSLLFLLVHITHLYRERTGEEFRLRNEESIKPCGPVWDFARAVRDLAEEDMSDGALASSIGRFLKRIRENQPVQKSMSEKE